MYRWAIAAGVLLACGSATREGPSNEGAGGNGNGTKLGAEAFCEAWFDVEVALLERCLPGNLDWPALFKASTQTCAELKSSIDAGRILYDADLGAECLRRVPTQDCDEVLEGEVQTLCTALVGQLPSGAACNPNTSECAGGVCLRSSGTCGAFCKELVQQGGQCSSANPCALNLGCVDGICTALPREDEACSGEARQCQGRAFCEGGNASQPGKCVPRRNANEACVDSNNCLSRRCVEGVCLNRKPVGADCVVGENECLVPAQCVDGKCTARFAESGEPCSEFHDSEIVRCADGLYCDRTAKVCLPLKSPGQSCAGTWECDGENPLCQSKICTPCRAP